jgi:hypothetical protein
MRFASSCLLALLVFASPAAAAPMKEYPTRYYIIYSDLDDATVKEASARVTTMAEEYHERTKGFAGAIRKRLPFYLYTKQADYDAAGGRGQGMYTGSKLMAVAADRDTVWQIVQHEGFHQFVGQVMGGKLPTWVEEGLAEYFGEALWTGDAYVTGVIPDERLARVKECIAKGEFLPFDRMVAMTDAQWIATLDIKNYDQAWAMVHFLVHGDGGKYRKAFSDFLRDCSTGTPAPVAFKQRFGADTKVFEERFRAFWTGLGDKPSNDTRATTAVQTATSFLARALAAKQAFKTWDEFLTAAKAGALQCPPDAWLPKSLLQSALASPAAAGGTWSLDPSGRTLRVVFTRTDGTVFTGSFTREGTDFKTRVDVKPAAAAPTPK